MIFQGATKSFKVLDYPNELFVRKMNGDRMIRLFEILRLIAEQTTERIDGSLRVVPIDLIYEACFLLMCKADGTDVAAKWQDIREEPFDAMNPILEQGLAFNHLNPDEFEELAGNSPATEPDSPG